MIYTNAELHTLQDQFIQSNDWAYYNALVIVASNMIRAKARKSGVFIPDIKHKAGEAALLLIEQYKKPGYRVVKDIAGRLSFDVRKVLYGPSQRNAEKEVELETTVLTMPKELSQDPILSVDSLDLYHLFSSPHYSQAIKAIAQAKGKAYCYQRSQELRYVFLMLKKGVELNAQRKNLCKHRPRGHGRHSGTNKGQ